MEGRKSACTQPAGPEFADAAQDLSVQWLETRTALREAEAKQQEGAGEARIQVICASPRTDETCPGEMSKTRDGRNRGIWRDGFSRSSSMATPKAGTSCARCCATG